MTPQEIKEKIAILQEEAYELHKSYSNVMQEIQKLKLLIVNEIPSYGDHMTMEDFRESVIDGGFMDDDGSGNYATATKMTNIDVHLGDVEDMTGDALLYSHVVWFNK